MLLCSFFVFLAATISVCYISLKKSPYKGHESIIVEYRNDGYICNLLKKHNISNFPVISKMLINVFKLKGLRCRVGEYKLQSNISLLSAIITITNGKSHVRKFTIAEGSSVYQILEKLNKDKLLLGEIVEIPKEGSLMPDTYFFAYPTTKQKIISIAQKEMKNFLEKEWENRSDNCVLKTPEEAVILASIVEKETHFNREKIAGIYTRRLKKNMRLQADPTVIYSVVKGAPFGRKITRKDLMLNLPHNTYVHKGLPPTPISNPGRASLLAALHPDDTNDIFFVIDNDSNIYSSKTYEDHKKNVKNMKRFSKR
jgi:UPF0755 protein